MTSSVFSYLLALLSAVFYSLNQIYNKRLTLLLGSLPALWVVYLFLVLFDFVFCLLFGNFSVPLYPPLAEIFFLSLVGALSIFFLFESFKRMPLGISITLANFSPIFLTLLMFLSEGVLPSFGKLFLIVALVGSVFLFFGDGRGDVISKRFLFYPLMTAFGWGLFGWETYRLLNLYGVDPFAVAFYSSLFMWFIFCSVCLVRCEGKSLLRKLKDRKVLKWGFLGGLFTSLGFVSSVFAFKGISPEEAPVIEAILTFTTPLGALTSYLLLGEKLSPKQVAGVLVSFTLLVLFFFV